MIEKFEQYKETALYFYGQGRTALTALAGLLALALAAGLLSGPAESWAKVVIGVATVLGAYTVKDDPTDAQANRLIDLGRVIARVNSK